MPCRQFYYNNTNTSYRSKESQLRHNDRNKQQDGYWHLNLSCFGLQTVHSKTFAVNGPIEAVILNNNRLTDLPDELAQLKDSLVRLELSGNDFTTLPKIIISLSRLETLQFSNNRLHQFPTSLLQLHHLTTLHLSKNYLTQIPNAISQMVGLRRLYLDHNRIEQIGQEFGNLTRLEILHLQGNNIRRLPTSLADLHALIELDCSDNPLVQPPPEICCQGVEVVRSYIRNQQMNNSKYYPKTFLVNGDILNRKRLHQDSAEDTENSKDFHCDRKINPTMACGIAHEGKILGCLRNSTLTSDDEGIQTDQCKTPNSSNSEGRRQQPYDHASSNSANRTSGKMRLRPWLEEKISTQAIPGLCWMDKENKIFRIPWKHAARQGWSVDDDASLFRAWAIHTGKFSADRDEPKPKVWKANFRCALNSLHDVEQITEDSITKGNDAVKVYRFLDGGKRKGDLSDPIYKNVLKKLRCEEASAMNNDEDLSMIKENRLDMNTANDLTTCKPNESIVIESKGGCFFFEDNGVCIRVGQNAIPDRITVSCSVLSDTSYQRQDDETVLGNILNFSLPLTRFAEPVTLCLPHQGFVNCEKQEIIIKYWSEADRKWHECELVDVSELARRILPANKQQTFTSYAGCKTMSLTSFVVISRTRVSRASFASNGGRLSSHHSKDVYVQVPEKTFSSVTELMLQVSPIENDVANVWVSQESRISPFVTLKCNKSTLTGPVTLSIPFTTECLNDTAFAASALISLSLQQSPTTIKNEGNKDQRTDSTGSSDSGCTPAVKKLRNGESESKGNLKIFSKKLKESEWQDITDDVKPSMKLMSDSISFDTRKQATYLIAFTKNSKDLTCNSVRSMFNRVCIPLVRMSVFYREMNSSYQIFVLCSSDSVIREVTQDFEKKMSAKCIYNSNLLKMAYGEACYIRFRGNLKSATGNKRDDFKLIYRPHQLQIKQFGLACVDVSHPLNGSIAFESYPNQMVRTLWSCEISFNNTVPAAAKPSVNPSVTANSIPVTSGPSKPGNETKPAWPAFSTPGFNVEPSRADNHPTWPLYVQPYPHLTIPASAAGGSVTAPTLNLNSPLMQSQSLTLIQQNHTAYGVPGPLLLPTHSYPQLNYNSALVNMPQSLLHHTMLPSITNDSLQYQSHFAGLMPLQYATALQRPMLSIGMPSPELFNEKVWPEVAKRLSGRWRDLATGLNISESHIDQIDKSCLNSEDKVNKIIYFWRQQTSGLPADRVHDEFQQAIKKCGIQLSEFSSA